MAIFLKIISILLGLGGCFVCLFAFAESTAHNNKIRTPTELFLHKNSGVLFAFFLLGIELCQIAWMLWHNTQPYIISYVDNEFARTHWLRSIGNKFIVGAVISLLCYIIAFCERKKEFNKYQNEIIYNNQIKKDRQNLEKRIGEYSNSIKRMRDFAYTIITEMSLDESLYIIDNYHNVYEIVKSLCTSEFGEYYDYTIKTIYKNEGKPFAIYESEEKTFLDEKNDFDIKHDLVNIICDALVNGEIELIPKHKMDHVKEIGFNGNFDLAFYLSHLS